MKLSRYKRDLLFMSSSILKKKPAIGGLLS